MKRIISILVFLCLAQSAIILPYDVEKKGVKLVAIDYARTPDALCVEAPIVEWVQNAVGKGIPAQKFLDNGWRPVGVTITNTTTKPMMLAPFYGKKTTAVELAVPACSMMPPYFFLAIELALLSGIVAPLSFVTANAPGPQPQNVRRNSRIILFLSFWTFAISAMKATADMYAFNQFYDAMKQKIEELSFNGEVLILPGQTIHKLLLCSKEEYISRFPLVIYPLENREEMIVFDVDLRA